MKYIAFRAKNVPVQVTIIRLIKENYLHWAAAINMCIAGRGCIEYINPNKDEQSWNQWYLENNKVETWIVNSMSSEIQSLNLRKKVIREMWMVLEQLYGLKKKDVCVYQLMNDIYSFHLDEKFVSGYYGALKAKQKVLNLHI